MAPSQVQSFFAQRAALLLCVLLLVCNVGHLVAAQASSGAGAPRGRRRAPASALDQRALSAPTPSPVIALAPQDSSVELGADVRLTCRLHQPPDSGALVAWTKSGIILGTL